MSASMSVGQSNLDIPRSPGSISTDSSTRSSLRQIHPEKHPEVPMAISPRARLTRKRAASLTADVTNRSRNGDLILSSAWSGPPSSDSSIDQVCLCQPDPKIPRPRNAFILYRQHYQAQVVAQNPGLANPEISKIIGEQWREQAPDVKGDWKRLAEEEKQRHQRQYPNYRYQPRRAGRSNGPRSISSSATDDQVRCPKCHGRYITTPNTPLTPFTPATGSGGQGERRSPSISNSCVTELDKPLYSSQMQNTRMDTPRALSHQQGYRRAQYAPPHPLSTHYERNEGMDFLSLSPGQKRRRFNDDSQRGYTANSPISYSTSPQYRGPSPIMSAGGFRSQRFPSPAMLNRPGTMGPPTQQSPIHQQSRQQYPNRSSIHDESLRLPPLQTQVSVSSSVSTQRPNLRTEARELHARSIEAMVMTIPYVNKIKVLRKISPPLQPPGPTSPAHDIRGAVVAVEGSDKILLAEVGAFILDYLLKDPSLTIRTWGSATATSQELSTSQEIHTEMTDGTLSAAYPLTPTPLAPQFPSKVEDKDPIVEYLSIISNWHNRSEEMTKYITTDPSCSTTANHETSTNTNTTSLTKAPRTLPIALVPNGFSLTISDAFALRTPINDSYAPVDHWQWMATLWRGIVGPDLTVYITRVGREELGKYGGVEVRKDCGAIIVRISHVGKMDEKTARRLGFEVVEFVRNVEPGFGGF